jgi:hypothetical protein
MTASVFSAADRASSGRTVPTAAAWLGGAGLIPFVVLAVAAATASTDVRPLLIEWLIRYAAVIVTFVGALHWGVLMRKPEAAPREQWLHLGWSIVPALLAWAALGVGPRMALLVLMVLFALQLAMDRRLVRHHDVVAWFLRMRVRLTLVALTALASGLAVTPSP